MMKQEGEGKGETEETWRETAKIKGHWGLVWEPNTVEASLKMYIYVGNLSEIDK